MQRYSVDVDVDVGVPGGEAVPVNDQNGRSVEREPKFRVRAQHTESTVTVYQAYRPEIGRAAALGGRFPSSWSRDRTWSVVRDACRVGARGGER